MKEIYEVQYEYVDKNKGLGKEQIYGFNSIIHPTRNNDGIIIKINKNEINHLTLHSLLLDGKPMSYLSVLSSYLDIARQHDKLLSWEQEVGLGYLLVKRGSKLTASYKSLGLPGYRDHQTYIFVTDLVQDILD